MEQRSNQAKSIFLAAIEQHAPAQWPAFLDRACAGDGPLRAEVEKLLRAQAVMGSFHEATRLDVPAADGLLSAYLRNPATLGSFWCPPRRPRAVAAESEPVLT